MGIYSSLSFTLFMLDFSFVFSFVDFFIIFCLGLVFLVRLINPWILLFFPLLIWVVLHVCHVHKNIILCLEDRWNLLYSQNFCSWNFLNSALSSHLNNIPALFFLFLKLLVLIYFTFWNHLLAESVWVIPLLLICHKLTFIIFSFTSIASKEFFLLCNTLYFTLGFFLNIFWFW